MKNRFLLFVTTFLFIQIGSAQTDSIRQRIFLVGDAGELVGGKHPVIDWLGSHVDWNDSRNTVLYLGDNIYPYGLPMEGEPLYTESKTILDYQINLVKGKKARAFFVPGNHDWANGKSNGWQHVQNEVNYINGLEQKNIQAWPLNGCPGPVEVELDEKVVLVFVDSQWFLHVNDKPGAESNCDSKTVDEFIIQLQEIADRHPNQLLILTMHHPMYTRGSHGGNYTLKSHIFPLTDAIPNLYIPLPVIGSIYPLTRGVFGSLQDVNHPLYRNMAKQIEQVLKTHPNAMQVAGHDHSLQLLLKDSIPYVVSGSGAKLTRVQPGLYSRFSDVSLGFATIEVRKSGKAEVKFYDLSNSTLDQSKFSFPLKTILAPIPTTTSIDTLYSLPRSITIAANEKIKTAGRKVFLHGENYRQEWNTPIEVPVFDIKKEQGGLKVLRRIGSSQNRALTLEDNSGKQWRLRSIQEFPQSIIPPDLVTPFAKDTISDALSATYPFASLSIGRLEKEAGITSLRRKLVYVPDDPRLERFRKDFSSTLAVLEEMEPQGVKETITTEELILRQAKDNNIQTDQKALLKTRLLDNFVMDFERAENQWRWAARPVGKQVMYYPFAGDHNQAFFVNDGIIPRIIRKPRYVPEIQGFRAKDYNIKTFNRSARNFDHLFLNKLSAVEWEKEIDAFIGNMSDTVIQQSLLLQPKEIHGLSMNQIISTLKEKREYFKKDMMTYYNFLSRKVDIVGSNGREYFLINKSSNGNVQVKVFDIDTSGNNTSIIYDRTFDPKVTQELRLYGLNDKDIFKLEGDNSPIAIRIIGGPGEDEFVNEAKGGKVVLYDVTFENNTVKGTGFSNRLSADPQANVYNRSSFKYDYSKLGISFGLNPVDYLLIGPKFESIKQGFRKDPYGHRHYLSLTHSLTSSSYQFKYEGDFIKAIGTNDLVIRADAKALGNTNFFGYGNTTFFDGQQRALNNYRAKYNIGNIDLLVRKRLQSWMQVYYGASFQTLKIYKGANQGKYISENTVNGLNPATLYKQKNYAGALLQLTINSRNSPVIPTRGFTLDAEVHPLLGLNQYAQNITRFRFNMAAYISLFNYPRFVLASRIGYGQNVGKFEYPQAQFLGGNDNLRGYRRQRFAGQSMVFNNTELRFRMKDIKFYLLPGAFGLLAFHDIGRVQVAGVHSKTWHTGYGGGVWLSPIKRFVLTGTLSFSKEEKFLPLVKIGFLF